MKFLKHLCSAICAFLLLGPTPALAAAKWLRADTHNFVIYSAGSRQTLANFATELEQFDAMMRLLFKIQADPQPARLTIYMLRSADGVSDLIGDKSGFVAGFYLPSKYGSFAVANREDSSSQYELSSDTVLFHEYAHHFMFHHFAFAYPTWYVEGFAEYVATAEFRKDGSWALGRVPFFRAEGLLAAPQLPMQTLLFDGPAKLGPIARDTYYGQSWLLVHMMSRDPARKGQLDGYIRAVASGTPEKDAAKATFGDLDVLAKDMVKYRSKPISYMTFKEPLPYDSSIAIAELDPVESRLIELDLRRQAGKSLPQTRDALAALSAQNPAAANVWLKLALAENALGDEAKDDAARATAASAAMAAVDKALAIDPKLGRANSLKAELLMEKLGLSEKTTPADWRQVRVLIGKANAADTEDPVPLFLFHQSYQRQGIAPPALASDGLYKAFLLRPEALDLRAQYAFDLANHKKYDEALHVLEFVARDPHDPAAGAALLKQIKDMRDGVKAKDPGNNDKGSAEKKAI